jgi:bifunctional non-homologous end joining protein LigD
VIDGEAVVLGVDGISDFNGLHSRRHDDEVQLYAFDMSSRSTATTCGSCRYHLRKTNLARLLARRPEGIFVSDFEQGEIGPDLFRKACEFGSRAWSRSAATALSRRTGRRHWVKVKNRGPE